MVDEKKEKRKEEKKEKKRKKRVKRNLSASLKLSVERDQCFSIFNLSRSVCGPIVDALYIAWATHDSSHKFGTPKLPCSIRQSHRSRA